MSNYLLIDGNSIGRAAHSSTRLTVGGEDVQAIFGFLRSMQGLLKKYPTCKPIVLWDGRAEWRFKLFPLYKGNRSDNEQKIADNNSYRLQRPKIEQALMSLGISQITDHDAEADDLAGYFSRKLTANSTNKVTLCSGDQDWCQLVTDQIDWVDHRDGRICNYKNFEEFTGFKTAKQFVEAKCLSGDTSDNIPGIGGIGDKGAVEFLNKHDSVEKFLLAMRAYGAMSEKMPKAWLRFALNEIPKASTKFGDMLPMQEAFYRNKKLMELNNYTPNKSRLEVRGGKVSFSKASFKGFCEDNLFRSILIQLDSWISPFENLRSI